MSLWDTSKNAFISDSSAFGLQRGESENCRTLAAAAGEIIQPQGQSQGMFLEFGVSNWGKLTAALAPPTFSIEAKILYLFYSLGFPMELVWGVRENCVRYWTELKNRWASSTKDKVLSNKPSELSDSMGTPGLALSFIYFTNCRWLRAVQMTLSTDMQILARRDNWSTLLRQKKDSFASICKLIPTFLIQQ